MLDDKKLLRLQREIKDLEKKEQNIKGSLKTLFKGLKKDLGNLDMKDKEVIPFAQETLKELKIKSSKSKKMFDEIMEEIEKMVGDMEDLEE